MHTQNTSIPVLAIDGGAGTGKGTARGIVAEKLGFNSLDSGILYRALALFARKHGLLWESPPLIAGLVQDMKLTFEGDLVLLNGESQFNQLRSKQAGEDASRIAVHPEVRAALLDYQLAFRKPPGLVADGRDQGTVFDTPFRYFLKARPEVRAQRRVEQERQLGHEAEFAATLASIRERDRLDETRKEAPLAPHPEAMVIDTSDIPAQEVARQILEDYQSRRPT